MRTTLDRWGWLLTRGELLVCRRFLALPGPQASLYARLHGRRGCLFLLEGLDYPEVGDIDSAAAGLVDAGFAWPAHSHARAVELAAALPVPALRRACRQLGRDHRGVRAALLERLADGRARPVLARRGLRIRHGALFRRIARLFLGRGDGDLSRLVVQRLQVVCWVPYQPCGDAGFFACRRDLLRYEAGRAVDDALERLDEEARRQALLRRVDEDLELVRTLPRPAPWLRRMSAWRLAMRRLLAAGAVLERRAEHARAAELYAELIELGPPHPGEVVHRLLLCLERLDRPAEAAALAQRWLDRVAPDRRLALARTGRRLARKAQVGWRPLPPLRQPRRRTVRLPPAERAGSRPGWSTTAGTAPVEAAVIAWLARHQRRAIHAENDLWRTLFGLLMVDLLFLPIPGMLPSPFRSAPLDLGTAAFAAHRSHALAERLAEIRSGGAAERVTASWRAHHGRVIRGVAWDRYPLPLLTEVVTALGGDALASIVDVLARDWRQGARGLPDLLILPGAAVRLPEAFPSRLPTSALFAEIKGPGDQLRDGQRIWFDRILAAGLTVELWKVQAASAGRRSAPVVRR